LLLESSYQVRIAIPMKIRPTKIRPIAINWLFDKLSVFAGFVAFAMVFVYVVEFKYFWLSNHNI
jgi:hypothetical protein